MSSARLLSVALILSVLCCAGCVKPPPGYPTPKAPIAPKAAPKVAEAVNTAPPAPAPAVNEAAPPENAAAPEAAPSESPAPEAAANTAAPAPPAAAKAKGNWEGVVGRETTPGEVREVPVRKKPAPKKAAEKPKQPSAAEKREAARRAREQARREEARREEREARARARAGEDTTWTRIQENDWEGDGRYPWASRVEVTPAVLSHFSNRQLSIMVMEMYARHGKRFDGEWWQDRFDEEDWYYPEHREVDLSATERANMKAIRRYQSKHFGEPWAPPSD